MSTSSRFAKLAVLLAAVIAAPAVADPFYQSGNLQLQGFAAQSLITTSHNNFFGRTQDALGTGFTEAGVNGVWQPRPGLLVAGQVLYRRAGKNDGHNVRLDYLQAVWPFWQHADSTLELRAGKIKIPYGLYNETRDVPFTRPSILLPESIYFDTARNFALAAPGAGLNARWQTAYGEWQANFAAVRPGRLDAATEANFLGGNRPGHLYSGATYAAQLRWSTLDQSTLLALSWVDARAGYRPAPGDPLGAGKISYAPWVLSAQQHLGTVTLTTEYGRPHIRLYDFNLPQTLDVRTRAWYVQGAWHFRPHWVALLRYDSYISPLKNNPLAALSGNPYFSRYAKDWTAGLRWDVTPTLMLRAEFHHVTGTIWLPALDNPNPQQEARVWNMGLLQASWRF